MGWISRAEYGRLKVAFDSLTGTCECRDPGLKREFHCPWVAYWLSLRIVVPIKVVAIDANRAKFNRSFRTTTPMNDRALGFNAPSYLRPPDTARVSPVMYLESDDARNTAAGAISSGCPIRPSGACVSTIF